MVVAGGEAADDLNLDAFIAQAGDYSESGSGLERITRLFQDLRLTHPMPVRRMSELLTWVQSGDYDRIVAGDYIRCGEEPPLRAETDAAQAHYGDRIADAFAQAGSSVTDVGQQLGDWLSRSKDRDA
jgi:hypothetical protein